MRQGVDVVGSAQLGIHLHNELSLTLKLFPIKFVLSLEIAACFISLFCLCNLLHSRLNDLVL